MALAINLNSRFFAVLLLQALIFAGTTLAQSSPSLNVPSTPVADSIIKKSLITPEGKTLPTGVARLRVPYQTQFGKSGFDDSGKKTTSSFRAKGSGSALVLEYGITDRLSFQWVTRYFHSQSVLLNAAHFSQSSEFAELKNQAYSKTFAKLGSGITQQTFVPTLEKVASQLIASKGGCNGQAALCLQGISQNTLLAPIDLNEQNTGLPGLNIKAGTSIKEALAQYGEQIDQMVDQKIVSGAMTYEKKGAEGLGDSEAGLLYQAFDNHWVAYSLGLGIRLPTGRCTSLASSELPTSRCTVDAAVRQNLDLLPIDFVMVSWQHQTEWMLRKGEYAYQGQAKTQVARNSARQVGFLVVKPSLAFIEPNLSVITAKVGIAYDYDSALVATSTAEPASAGLKGQRNYVLSEVYGLGLDGTMIKLPVALEVDYNRPLEGKNKAIAPASVVTTLKVYARF